MWDTRKDKELPTMPGREEKTTANLNWNEMNEEMAKPEWQTQRKRPICRDKGRGILDEV